jgi:membrane protein DedA with SNARE-associated domain
VEGPAVTDTILSMLDGIAGLPLWALALAVALAVAAESSLLVGLIVPGDLIVLLAASGGSSAPRAVVLVVAVVAGSVAGETLGYGIGHRWGGRVRTSRLGQALGEERWDRAGRALHHRGGRAVFGARYVAAVHAVLPVAAGTLRMPIRKFLAWSTAGAVTWATLYVCVGAAAGASFREAGEHLAGATLAVVLAMGAAVALLWLRNRHRRRHAAPAGPADQAGADGPGGAASTTANPWRDLAGTGGVACGGTDTTSAISGPGRDGGTGRAGGTGGTGCGAAGAAGLGGSGVRVAAALAPPTADRRGSGRSGCDDHLAA